MSKMKFKLNRAGVRELMRSEEMKEVLMSYAREIADEAGEGYEPYLGRNRYNIRVETAEENAYKDNLKNNTLEKVIRR